MAAPSVTVRDKDGDITLGYGDLLKYATRVNVIASALMIRLCGKAFSLLSPEEPVCRRELYWRVGFPGGGILDCIEMLSHAVREGRCLQDPTACCTGVPASLVGSFFFEIRYRGRTVAIWPDEGIFDDEFRSMVATWQELPENAPGRDAYLRYKERKVSDILALPDEKLFHWTLH